MKRSVRDFLRDILDAITSIDRFIEGFTFDSFCEDEKTIFAVTHGLERVGEATKKVTDKIPSVKEKYPHIHLQF
ncbi:MAG: HepT-like ribonuclease domain-containing protein [Cyanobacterium sp.]